MSDHLLFPFATPPPTRWWHRPLAAMLQRANAMAWRLDEQDRVYLYAVKDHVLTRYATPDGIDWQEITRYCHSCEGTGGLYEPHGCYRCGGTGIWSRRYHQLHRYRLAGYVFHRPTASCHCLPPGVEVAIKGRVQHYDPGPAGAAAYLWLLLWFSPSLFLRRFGRFHWRCCGHSPILWANWILGIPRRTVQWVRNRIPRWTRCECGRFTTDYWSTCRRCRDKFRAMNPPF